MRNSDVEPLRDVLPETVAADEVPVLHPTLEDMENFASYLAGLHDVVERHGGVRIDPPVDWPQPALRMTLDSRFFVRMQRLPGVPPPDPATGDRRITVPVAFPDSKSTVTLKSFVECARSFHKYVAEALEIKSYSPSAAECLVCEDGPFATNGSDAPRYDVKKSKADDGDVRRAMSQCTAEEVSSPAHHAKVTVSPQNMFAQQIALPQPGLCENESAVCRCATAARQCGETTAGPRTFPQFKAASKSEDSELVASHFEKVTKLSNNSKSRCAAKSLSQADQIPRASDGSSKCYLTLQSNSSEEECGGIGCANQKFVKRGEMSFAKRASNDGGNPFEIATEQYEAEFWKAMCSGIGGSPVEIAYGVDVEAEGAYDPNSQSYVSWNRAADSPPANRAASTCASAEDSLSLPVREASRPRWHVGNISFAGLLRHLPRMPGINHSMYYVGQLFTRFCWHTEDAFLNSISYLHAHSADKVWYVVPPEYAAVFEAYASQEVFGPEMQGAGETGNVLLGGKTVLFDPRDALRRGIPVHKIVHKSGTFVFTAPQAYHGGFNCGFNIAEAVNFALPSWFPRGRLASILARSVPRSLCLPHELLLMKEALALVRALCSEGTSSGRRLFGPTHGPRRNQPPVSSRSCYRYSRKDACTIANQLRMVIEAGEDAIETFTRRNRCSIIEGWEGCGFEPTEMNSACSTCAPSLQRHRARLSDEFGRGAGVVCAVCGHVCHFYVATCGSCSDGGSQARCPLHFVAEEPICTLKRHRPKLWRRYSPVFLYDLLGECEFLGGIQVSSSELLQRYTGFVRQWTTERGGSKKPRPNNKKSSSTGISKLSASHGCAGASVGKKARGRSPSTLKESSRTGAFCRGSIPHVVDNAKRKRRRYPVTATKDHASAENPKLFRESEMLGESVATCLLASEAAHVLDTQPQQEMMCHAMSNRESDSMSVHEKRGRTVASIPSRAKCEVGAHRVSPGVKDKCLDASMLSTDHVVNSRDMSREH